MAKFRRPTVANPEVQRLKLHGRQLMQTKRHDLAEGIWKQVLAILSEDAETYRQLAVCMLILRRYAEGVDHAKTAVSLKPDSDVCHTTLGLLLRSAAKPEEAIAAYMQALRIKADCQRAFAGLAQIHAVAARWDQAMLWVERALAIKPDDVATLQLRGEGLAALGKADEAVSAMQEFLRVAPDQVLSQIKAASILRRLNRLEEAAEFAQRALSMAPADPGVHNLVAQLNLRTKKFDDAHRHFSEAGLIFSSRQEGRQGSPTIEIASLLGQAAVHSRRREFQVAEAQYRRVLEINPDHGVAKAVLSGVIAIQYRFEQALQMARETAQNYPDLQLAHIMLGSILAQMEQFDEAMTPARRALELDPKSALANRVLAAIYAQMEDYSSALDWIQKSIRLKQDPETTRLLAVIQAGLGHRDESIVSMNVSLKQEPDNPSSYECSGTALFLLGDFEQAISQFRRAREMDPVRTENLSWIGLAQFRMGKMSEALPALNQSIAINPYQRLVREALTTLAAGTVAQDTGQGD